MGKSSKNTSSRKTEKGTQSPMLKLFKEYMIRKEKETCNDKRTFVKDKQPHVSSKSRAYDPESNDKQPHRIATEYKSNSMVKGGKSDSDPDFIPRRDEKTESWWFSNDGPSGCKGGTAPSTCSRVSCQFKRMLTTEYLCLGLLVLFLLCFFSCGCCYAYKMMSLPTPIQKNLNEADDSPEDKQDTPDAKEGYLIMDPRTKPDPDARFTIPEYYKRYSLNKDVRRSIFDETQLKSGDASGLYEAYLHADAIPTQSSVLPSYDLSNILDTMKLSEENMNPKIKNFYRKLLETDAQIQNLKKGLYQSGQQLNEGTNQNLYENMFRLKRSLFHRKKNKKHKIMTTTTPSTTLPSLVQGTSSIEKVQDEKDADLTNGKVQKEKDADLTNEKVQKEKVKDLTNEKVGKDATVVNKFFQKTSKLKHKSRKPSKKINQHKSKNTRFEGKNRVKRFPNGTEMSGEFEIERQKTIVRYGVGNMKYRKSNVKDVHESEHELLQKTPFYKNSRHFDDLLHHYLDNPFTLQTESLPIPVPATVTPRLPVKTKQASQVEQATPPRLTIRPEDQIQDNVEKAKKLSAEFFNYFITAGTTISTKSLFDRKDDQDPNLPLDYGSNPLYDLNQEKRDVLERLKLPNRRLLGYDQDDENQPEEMVGYEDFKEVLSDDMGAHDETDRPVERKKRDPVNIGDTLTTHSKTIPPGVYNPNWKGPLPLYPDEVNTMLKNMLPIQKILDLPLFYKHQKMKPPVEIVDAVETYEIYPEHVVSLAQAYSDYGVYKEKNSKEIKSQENAGRKLVTQKLARKKRSLDDFFVKDQMLYSSLEQPTDNISTNNKNPDDSCQSWNKTETKNKLKIMTPNGQVTIHSDFVIISNNGGKLALDRPTTPIVKTKKKKKLRNFFNRWRARTTETAPVVEPEKTITGGNIYVFHNSHAKTASPSKTIENADSMLTDLHITTKTSTSTAKRRINPSPKRNNLYRLSRRLTNKKSITLNRHKRTVGDFFTNTIGLSATYTTLSSDNDTDKTVNNEHNITARSVNETSEAKSKPEDLFLILSDFFAHMANTSANNPFASHNETKLSDLADAVSVTASTVTRDIIYPQYDSDMIDNIGHRSRVLLSIEDEHVNKTKRCKQDGVVNSRKVIDNATGKDEGVRTDHNTTTYSPTVGFEPRKSNLNDELNKTNAKRQAHDDKEFVFWSDLYDDEYGVKLDQLNENADRSADRSSDLVKDSANWFQDKMRKMTNSFRRKYITGVDVKKVTREKRDALQGSKVSYKWHVGKLDKKGEPKDFVGLTAHMKEICKQASIAVRETRDMKHKQDPELEMSAGLMQNLVKLMSDLVNFQVHQKTCLKLPEDLRGFLEWLTKPQPDVNSQQTHSSFGEDLAHAVPVEKEEIIDLATTQSSEKEGGLDVRSECLGTLQAVQDLIQEYSALSDADKVSMGNVMEYLEGQLDYLNKQLNSIDELNLANMEGKNSIAMPSRYRRYIQNNRPYYTYPPSLLRTKRKFFNYNKTHTKSTYNNVESIQVTVGADKKKPSPNDKVDKVDNVKRQALVDVYDNKDINIDNKDRNNDNDFDVTKRNLKDVYYKAMDDAKKTTLKSMHAKEFDEFEQAPVIRM